LEVDVEQSGFGELVEVVGREWSADAGLLGYLIPGHRCHLLAHVFIKPPPHGVGEAAQRRDGVLVLGLFWHIRNLTLMNIDQTSERR
jgi:hypothetical protein